MLSGWTGNCGCELIDSETANILGYTGDENIPVEGVCTVHTSSV